MNKENAAMGGKISFQLKRYLFSPHETSMNSNSRARIQRRYKEAKKISFCEKDIFSEVRQHSRASNCFPLELLAKFI
jgi:hypothetical protein